MGYTDAQPGNLLFTRSRAGIGSGWYFQFAIYYLPTPTSDPTTEWRRLLVFAERMPRLVNEKEETPVDSVISVKLNSGVQEEYASPGLDSIQYFGRGLSREQAVQLQDCKQAFLMNFGHPQSDVL